MPPAKGLRGFLVAATSSTTKLVSVDVFDTLLLRHLSCEPARHFECASRHGNVLREFGISGQITQEDLYLARLYSAKTAYRMRRPVHGARESNIEEIFTVMLSILNVEQSVSSRVLPRLIDAELEFEISQLSLNRRLLEILNQVRSQGKKLLLISDMYLRAAHLERLLRRLAPTLEFDGIYSSADFGFGKVCKGIFQVISEQFECSYTCWVHGGDNFLSDYAAPRQLGIDAYYMPRPLRVRLARFVSLQRMELRFGAV